MSPVNEVQADFIFSYNKSSRSFDKNVPKIEMKGVSPNQKQFLLKCKCVKYSHVQKRIRKLIAYYMAHFPIVKYLMVRNLNENFYWHFNYLLPMFNSGITHS